MEQQEEQVGESVVEERNGVKDSEGEGGKEEEEGEKEEGRKEEEKEEGEKNEGVKDVEEGKEADSQQRAASEGGIAEEPAPEESTITTEEQTVSFCWRQRFVLVGLPDKWYLLQSDGEKGGGDEVIDQGGSEGGRGEDGDKEAEGEGREHEVVMGEASTVEETPTSEVGTLTIRDN